MRNGIAAVLIVKNEEKLLERCLKSLDLVDDIVILDTGSTDRTIHIAKAHTSKVYQAPPVEIFHFADARNQALAYVKQDWALTIDADEICHPGCIQELRKAVWNNSLADGFNVRFIVSSEGGENPASIQRMKLFRRNRWKWEYRIHEILKPVRNPVRVLDLPSAVMEHLPPVDKEARRQQNVDLLKLSVQESPEYIRNSRQLGMELFSREQYREAITYLQLYLASGTGGALDRSETLTHVARCYSGIGVLADALRHFDLAVAEAPSRREPLYFKAIALIKEAHPDQAIPVLERCLSIPEAAKPDFYLNIERVWDGQYPNEALKFCRDTVEEYERSQKSP